MTYKPFHLATALLLAGAFVVVAGAEEVSLKLDLKPGDAKKVIIMAKTKGSAVLVDERIQGETSVSLRYDFEVESVDSQGNMVMKAKLRHIRADRQATIGGDREYNPFANENGLAPIQEIARVVVDLPFTFTLEPSGRVLHLASDPATQEALAQKADLVPAKVAQMMTDEEKDAFVQRILAHLNAESVEADMRKLFHLAPDAPVEVGESWPLDPVNDNNGEVVIERTVTITDRKAGRLYGVLKGKLSTPEAKKDEVEFIVDGDVQAQLHFDTVSGLCVFQEYTLHADMTDPAGVFKERRIVQEGRIEMSDL